MGDSTLPPVLWSDWLNGDYDEAEFGFVHNEKDQGLALAPSDAGGYQPNQQMQFVADSSTAGQQPAEDCLFPCDIDQPSGPHITASHLNINGGASSDQSLPYTSVEEPPIPTPQKTRSVFSPDARRIVKAWLDTHAGDPYPTAAEKAQFSEALNLSSEKISTLFNNIRRRHTGVSPTSGTVTSTSLSPLAIAALPQVDKDDTPMSHYLSSSPEEDPQPMEIVAEAAASLKSSQTFLLEVDGSSRVKKKRKLSGSQNDGGSDISSCSGNTTFNSSSYSNSGSSHASGKQGKRRTTTARQSTTKKGKYYCTYCWMNFASSSAWRKHEETIHMPQKEVECRMSELKPTLIQCGACFQAGSEAECRQGLNHNYLACIKRTKETRTFYRIDHFQNHLGRIHSAVFTSQMEDWVRSTSNNPKSRCGFCLKWFPTWTERLDHIGDHYKFHDDFDKSKWQLKGEEESEAVGTATRTQKKDKDTQSSALVKHEGQPGLRLEVNSFLKLHFIERHVPTIPGNNRLFTDWERLGLRKIRRLEEASDIVFGEGAGAQHYDCPAVGGGECKFKTIQNLNKEIYPFLSLRDI